MERRNQAITTRGKRQHDISLNIRVFGGSLTIGSKEQVGPCLDCIVVA